MNSEWSLDTLYTGYDDPRFAEDEKELDLTIQEILTLTSDLSGDPEDVLSKAIQLSQKVNSKISSLFFYAQLRMSVNTSDVESAAAAGRLSQKLSLSQTAS